MFNKKKAHFKRMLQDIQTTVWELEFKRFKMSAARENVRKEYEIGKDALTRLTTQLETDPKNEKILKDKEAVEARIQGVKAQIDAIDAEIADIPVKMDAFVALREYVKHFIQKFC